MFRCPSCAKVWKLPIKGGQYSLMMNMNLNEAIIAKEPIGLPGSDRFIFIGSHEIEDVAKALEDNKLELDFNEENEIECPACHKENKFEDWVKCWKYPGDYFDADMLCGCGGELWMEALPNGMGYGFICDDCGWVKPRKVISGAESDVV